MPLITMAREGVDKYLVVNTETKRALWVKSALVWELDKAQEDNPGQEWSPSDSYTFATNAIGQDLGAVTVETIPQHPDTGYDLTDDGYVVVGPDRLLRVAEALRNDKAALTGLLTAMSSGGVAFVDPATRVLVRFIGKPRVSDSQRRQGEGKGSTQTRPDATPKGSYETEARRKDRWRETTDTKPKQSTFPVVSAQKTNPTEAKPTPAGQEAVLDRFFNELMANGTTQVVNELKKVQARLVALEAIEARLGRIERVTSAVESSVSKFAVQPRFPVAEALPSARDVEAELEREKRTVQSLQIALQNERTRVEAAQSQAVESLRKQLAESLLDLRGLHEGAMPSVMDHACSALRRALDTAPNADTDRVIDAFVSEFKAAEAEISFIFGQVSQLRSRLIEMGVLRPRG